MRTSISVDFSRRWCNPIITEGVFNARLRVRGDTFDPSRGRFLADLMVSVDMVCVNRDTHPTYIRKGWSQSVIDLTFFSSFNWKN